MSALLEEFVDQTISMITNDGRHLVGTFRGMDQHVNIVIEECFERVYKADRSVAVVRLGLYLIRGDNVAVVGELDHKLDQKTKNENIRAEPLKPIVH